MIYFVWTIIFLFTACCFACRITVSEIELNLHLSFRFRWESALYITHLIWNSECSGPKGCPTKKLSILSAFMPLCLLAIVPIGLRISVAAVSDSTIWQSKCIFVWHSLNNKAASVENNWIRLQKTIQYHGHTMVILQCTSRTTYNDDNYHYYFCHMTET